MDSQVYEALVIAVLSVNSYPLEKAWEMRATLEKVELFNPTRLASLRKEEIGERLQQAGYDRGQFLTDLIASRLQSVSQYLVELGLQSATHILASGGTEEVRSMLIKTRGIGPTVIRNFLLLRGQGPERGG